jgi:cleavage and polyadenylation specificity factor subunit 5
MSDITVHVHALDAYDIHPTRAIVLKDPNPKAKLDRAEIKYQLEGMRRVVEAVLLVHIKGHAHVLLLQHEQYFVLPGGKLKPGEDNLSGLVRKLNNKLGEQEYWDVLGILSCWYRPNNQPTFYPYLPPHCTRPKEQRTLYLVHLPEKCVFEHPENLDLRAVPLFDLYNNAEGYGSILSSIPACLSRVNISSL